MSVEGHRHDQYVERNHVHAESQVTGLIADLAAKAPLVSPALTGAPTAPTASADTNTTQVATTAFVVGQAASATPVVNGTAATGTSLRFARGDHVHPTDTTRAADSAVVHTTGTESIGGAKTFTTTPLTVSPAVDDNSTKVATTAFVLGQAASATPVMDGTAATGTATRFARADHIHPTDTSRAPVASPSFTGNASAAGTISASGLAGSLLSSATPLADTATASIGSSAIPARQDHSHPMNTQLSRCTSNTTQATSGTYVAATGMSAAALVAGGVYKFEIVGTYSCSATSVGIAHRLSYPTLNYGAASSFHFTNTTAVSSVNNPGGLGASPTTITGANVGVAGTALLFRIEGMLAPSADGNFSYSFSPASAGSATVAGNTWFLVTRVA